ncbi:MAG: hypothetical protein IJH64_01535 [Oscillospiraceae bacterium]|nr:hypothetical protein [Oscillospiraceae bacterium]
MAICHVCKGKCYCTVCGGTGLLTINPHSSPAYVRTAGDGKSKCYACNGTGKCCQCNGTGRV